MILVNLEYYEMYISPNKNESLSYLSETGKTWGNATAKAFPKMPLNDMKKTDDVINMIDIKNMQIYVFSLTQKDGQPII